jgi:putative transposase
MKAGSTVTSAHPGRKGNEIVGNHRISVKRVEQMYVEQQGIRKTFKHKRKPTPEQERLLEHALTLCRHIYNAAVGERREAWYLRGITATYHQQKAELPDIKVAMPEYDEVHSQVLQNMVLRVDRALQAFFQRTREGKTSGFPRFHGRDRYNSFTYPQFGNGATLDGSDNGFLILSKLGRIAVRWSRPLEGAPKTVTVSREADGWYACFFCVEVPIRPLPPPGQETGIGRGIEAFATFSDGTRILHPSWYRKAERALKTAPRRVSRRKKGSNRRKKALALLARAHQRARRQRQDYHHKTAIGLVRVNDTIYHEGWQTANMVRRHHLARSMIDAGWSAFLTILSFKAACAGRSVVAVPPAYTSQTCSGCGAVVSRGSSVRWRACPECGTSLHRDHNAALNFMALGRELSGAGQALQAST